ncbi:ABC transporter permease subunit [Aquamicrobium lusatiense]|uniref:ABC transporter permease n=1 Tax=Aquamicrobium lusatiense TaxID=89772 RepID=UPI002457858E|nr:ABC transporter permease subunit [Aquamicrobium lusatiense]MDH4989334.1 ABC transporter permease subunit [Aquamicrobium lusatiense]
MLILIFGFGETTKLTIIALGSFVPLYLNTFAGIRLTDPRHLELARAQRLTRWQSIRDVVLPGALPSIFTGLRFSLGVTWITLIVAESFSVDPGIGYMARHARERNMTEIVVLSVVIYAVLGKLNDLAVRAIEARTLNWHVNFAARVS